MSIATAPAPAAPQTLAGVPALPPGPSAPRAVQTLAWTLRTGPFLDRNRARFGDQFTIKIEGGQIKLAWELTEVTVPVKKG